jgi:riboflavin biosynthesis pyrimidine reductase
MKMDKYVAVMSCNLRLREQTKSSVNLCLLNGRPFMKPIKTFSVTPRLAEFSSELIPIPEITAFYTLDHALNYQTPDRPYTWSNTVCSVDGVISFLEPGTSAGKEIALGHIPRSGSGSDWRLLNGGWMFADAVVSSGTNLRTEPDLLYSPHFEDLQNYRLNVLKKPKAHPLQVHCLSKIDVKPFFVVLCLQEWWLFAQCHPLLREQVIITRSGDIPFTHNLFQQHCDVEKLILTSVDGIKRVFENARKTMSLESSISTSDIEQALFVKWNTRVKAIKNSSRSGENGNDDMNLIEAWRYLRQEEKIEFLDVSAGSVVISQLLQQKLLDEYRFTLSGSVFGHTNSNGKRRTLNFVESLHFTPNTSPLLHYVGIRLFGEHHLFVRALWEYRH